MKKLIAVVCLAVLVVPAQAGFKVSGWSRWGAVAMNDVNNYIESVRETYVNAGMPVTVDQRNDMGIMTGGDLSYEISPRLAMGVRVAKLTCTQAKYSLNYQTATSLRTFNNTIDTSLMPVLAGLSFIDNRSETLSLFASLYAGYGFADGTLSVRDYLTTGGVRATVQETDASFEGGNLVADFSAGMEYKFAPWLSAGLSVNYMAARVTTVKYSKDVLTFKKGQTLRNSAGKDLVVDYSSFMAGLSLNFLF